MSTKKWAAAGAAAAAIAGAGAALYYWRETATEKPDYRLLDSEGDFELRLYPELLVAETVTHGLRHDALDAGFRILADYIFAKSRDGEKIAMTAPVLADAAHDDSDFSAPVLFESLAQGGWRTRFVMPASLRREELPTPPEGVKINEIAGRRVVAIRFSGRADDRLLADKESELRLWAMRNGFVPSGQAEHAFYNSPLMPGPLRRNEILIPVA